MRTFGMTFALMLALSLAGAPAPAAAGFLDGSRLQGYCGTGGDSFNRGLCIGYVLGVADRLFATQKICLPLDAKGDDIVAVVDRHFLGNPEDRQGRADVLVETALRQAYPCA